MDVLNERQAWLPELGQFESSADIPSTFDVDDMPTEALMFQAGYLTIAETHHRFGEYWYQLRYPNQEVYQSLVNSLLRRWTQDGQPMMGNKRKLGELLIAHDFAGMQTLFTAFFASIPAPAPAPGLDLTLEDAYRHGRLEMDVGFNQQIYLFEFKVVGLTPEGKALQQIKDKGYADKYRAEGHPIHLIGVEFSREQRSVVGFEVESL